MNPKLFMPLFIVGVVLFAFLYWYLWSWGISFLVDSKERHGDEERHGDDDKVLMARKTMEWNK